MTLSEPATAALRHPLFTRAKKSAQIVEFLAANSGSGREARAIRLEGLTRLNHGDAETIPTAIARAQALLDRFFETPEGRQFPTALKIVRKSKDDPKPEDLYALRHEANVTHGPSLRAFWQAYFDRSAATWIVYGEPLFMKEKKDGADSFIRDVRINERKDVEPPRVAAYPFLRMGEVQCMLEFTRFFTECKTPLRWYPCRRSHGLKRLMQATGGSRTQVIVLGNTFSNGILLAYQDYSAFAFYMEGAAIYRKGEPAGDGERIFRDGTDPKYDNAFTTHALVSRRHGFDPSTYVTTIASDNGPAIVKVGRVLCSEQDLHAHLSANSSTERFMHDVPEEFQLVFKVWVHQHDDTPIHCTIIDAWAGSRDAGDER